MLDILQQTARPSAIRSVALKTEETLSWSPTAGEHQVTVSDGHGRTTVRKITVEAAQ